MQVYFVLMGRKQYFTKIHRQDFSSLTVFASFALFPTNSLLFHFVRPPRALYANRTVCTTANFDLILISNQLVFLVRFKLHYCIIFVMCLSNNSGIDLSQSLPHRSKVLLNGFAPNSQWRRVWSLARMSLDVKLKGQCQRSRSPGTKKRA